MEHEEVKTWSVPYLFYIYSYLFQTIERRQPQVFYTGGCVDLHQPHECTRLDVSRQPGMVPMEHFLGFTFGKGFNHWIH